MNRLIFISAFTTLFTIASLAQSKLAIVKDKEGYTYIQSAKGADFDIVCEIKSDDFFYCEKASGDFYPVVATQRDKSEKNYGRQVKGFLHKSHVQLVEEMPIGEQKKMIANALEEYKKINEELNRIYSAYKENGNHFISKDDSTRADELNSSTTYVNDSKYEAIIFYFPTYYCKTGDIELLSLLFSTMWANSGTADEMPSVAICDSYLCNEQLYLKELRKIKDQKQLDYLIGQTNWGLLRHFDIDPESKNITNKELLRLSNQLKIK